MDKNTRWFADIAQRYTAKNVVFTTVNNEPGTYKSGSRTAHVACLRIKAGSAKEAMSKANDWLEQEGIEDAYVNNVSMEKQPIIEVE